jgi:hypothetical protein
VEILAQPREPLLTEDQEREVLRIEARRAEELR